MAPKRERMSNKKMPPNTQPSEQGGVSRYAKIRAHSARHGSEILITSAIVLVFLVLFIQFKSADILIAEIFLLSAALVGMLVGYLKLREPFYSIFLDKQKLSYNHKYGWWQLDVDNLQQVGVVSIEQAMQTLELNVVGLSLKREDEFLNKLSPRLAGRLLVEQRHYLLQAIKAYCRDGNECPPQWLVEDTEYVSQSGQKYTGLLAMFANRMKNLKFLTGYEILIPAAMLDRDIWAFSYLLHRWQRDPANTVVQLQQQLNSHSSK